MAKLEGKIALVTGASKGIGAGIAKHLGAAGAEVIVNYATSKSGADAVVDHIISHGGKAIAVQADISKPDEISRLFADIKERYGKLNILVNNAGVYNFGPLESVTPEEFHRMFNLNVLGLMLATQAAVNLIGSEGGSIINIGSVVGSMPPAYTSIYAATKGAVDNITISLSKELGARNIRVNGLNPGLTDTEGAKSMGMPQEAMDEFVTQAIKDTPLGRIGLPEDMGPVAVFLASDDARWITGQRIHVSGGVTI